MNTVTFRSPTATASNSEINKKPRNFSSDVNNRALTLKKSRYVNSLLKSRYGLFYLDKHMEGVILELEA